MDKAFRGIHKTLSNQDYHALHGFWSSTQLKYLYDYSPKHFKAKYIDQPPEMAPQTKDQLLGSLVHCLVLEPDNFSNLFCIMPELNLRTNAGKEAKAQFLGENSSKTPITKAMYEHACLMSESVLVSAPDILSATPDKEISLFWDCPFSGLPLKAKLDGLGPDHLLELKTTSSASENFFSRQAFNYHYDLSLVHYLEGVRILTDKNPSAYFVTVESDPPFVCQVYKASESFLTAGRAKWLEAISKLENGIKESRWPGYFSGESIPELQPPAWAVNKMVKEENKKVSEEWHGV